MQDKDVVFKITEIFRSIQGEGVDTGCPAVFVRMAGCNLQCCFCDTNHEEKFVLNDEQLVKRIIEESQGTRLVVFTGGEPLCQPIVRIVPQLKAFGFYVGVETNGTIETDPLWFNSLSLSPKIPFRQCRVPRCHSLKLLYPYLNGVTPEDYKMMYAGYKFIQPIWFEGDMVRNLQVQQEAAQEVIRLGDGWRLGLQIHKFINLR